MAHPRTLRLNHMSPCTVHVTIVINSLRKWRYSDRSVTCPKTGKMKVFRTFCSLMGSRLQQRRPCNDRRLLPLAGYRGQIKITWHDKEQSQSQSRCLFKGSRTVAGGIQEIESDRPWLPAH